MAPWHCALAAPTDLPLLALWPQAMELGHSKLCSIHYPQQGPCYKAWSAVTKPSNIMHLAKILGHNVLQWVRLYLWSWNMYLWVSMCICELVCVFVG